MASSFSYTAQKVKNNVAASKYVQNWVQKGMEATTTKIVNNADNQNVVYDSSGILCRTYDDLIDTYDLCQSRWINSGLYVTDDGWKSVKAAVGKYIYIDPETGNEVTTMGVIGDTIVGKLIIGENLGIYNLNNSMTFNIDGLRITNGINTFTVNPNSVAKLLKISKYNTDIFYVDDNGNLNLTGNVNGCSFDGGKINIGDGNFVVNEDGSVISKSTITGATLRGGSIGIGGNNNDNFVVNSDGSVISKASFSFGNGALMYNLTNGMSIKGNINAYVLNVKRQITLYDEIRDININAIYIDEADDDIVHVHINGNNTNVVFDTGFVSWGFASFTKNVDFLNNITVSGKVQIGNVDYGDNYLLHVAGRSYFNGNINLGLTKYITISSSYSNAYNIFGYSGSNNLHIGSGLYDNSVNSNTYVSGGNNTYLRTKTGNIKFQPKGTTTVTITDSETKFTSDVIIAGISMTSLADRVAELEAKVKSNLKEL